MLISPILVSIVAAGTSFSCTPTQVWDGDGPVWCKEGPRIRLAGIAAREMDDTCRARSPCPAASAVDARDALVNLLGRAAGIGPRGHVLIHGASTMRCTSDGWAKGNRTAAWCMLQGRVALSCAMIQTRTVLPWPRYMRDRHC